MPALIAAPLAGALGVSIGTATTIATAGLYVATTAASIFLQMSMMDKPEQEIGTKLSAVLGGAVNQSIHVGDKETAGSFIYKGSWGIPNRTPNGFLVRVYCLSDRPVDGFRNYIWADGRKCSYDPGESQTIGGVNVGHPVDAFNERGGHRLWVKFYDGTQTSADGYLTTKFGSGSRAWTSNHVGRGRAYMIVTQKYDPKAPTGEVEVTAVIQNSKFYDLRNDSTNGGSGTQRYDQYNTYAVEPGNPIIAAYNVMRGVYRADEWMYGGQKWPASRFDNDTWIAAANKGDENVSISGGGTQKRYRMGAEIDVSEEPWTVIERMLKACNGRIVESGGKFKVYVGGIGASVYSFTDDEVILSEEMTGRVFPTRDQIANTVNGTYVEPNNAGETKAYKAKSIAALVTEDGDVRKTTLDFDYVRDNRQAQRLARLSLLDNRRFRTFAVAFWSQARKIEPCDVVSWTSERFQFTDKKFIVGDVVLRDDGVVILNLREADASDSDWTVSNEDAFETGVFDDIEVPTQILGATITSVPFSDDTGKNRRPAIKIEAVLDDDYVDCLAIRYQVRKRFGDQKIIHRGRNVDFFDPDSENYGTVEFTSASIAAMKGKQVQVRHKIDPQSDRPTDWSDWTNLTLLDIGIDDDDTSDDLLAAPTSLSLTKVQQKDEDGTIRTFIRMNVTPPAWAGDKAEYIYEVEVEDDDTYRVKSKSAKARFRVNRTNKLHTVRARMRNGVGQLSNWTAALSITPSKKSADASAVTGLSVTKVDGKNVLKWNKIDDPDNREVGIYRNTTNDFGTAVLRDTTKSTKYTDNRGNTKNVRYYYWVIPIDTSGNIALSALPPPVDEVETGIILTDTDTTLLAAPTGISLFQANRDLNADGTVDIALRTTFSGGVALAAGYEFQWVDSAGQTASARADTGTAWFSAVNTRSYQVRWRTISWNGQPGPWSSYSGSVTPSGVVGAPAQPGVFSSTAGSYGFSFLLTSPPTELDYAFSEISIDGSNIHTTATYKGSGFFSGTVFTGGVITSRTIYMRHVNTSGLKSAWRSSNTIVPQTVYPYQTIIGTSSSGSISIGSLGDSFLVTLSWICDNNAAGVNVNIAGGSDSYSASVDFVAGSAMSRSVIVNNASSISASRSSGQWRGVVLTAVRIPT